MVSRFGRGLLDRRGCVIEFRLAMRVEAVRALLRSYHDYLPTTSGSLPTSSGPAPGRRVPCETCHRHGRVIVAGESRLCLVCDGAGWRQRCRGEEGWSEYLGSRGEHVPDEQAPRYAGTMTSSQMDVELARLLREEAHREGRIVSDEKYGWERAREARDSTTSYPELDRALTKLRHQSPEAHQVIRLVYFSGLGVPLGGRLAGYERAATAWLALEMEGKIRLPRHLYEEIRGKRVALILVLHAEGMGDREIARAAGCSQRFVRRAKAEK